MQNYLWSHLIQLPQFKNKEAGLEKLSTYSDHIGNKWQNRDSNLKVLTPNLAFHYIKLNVKNTQTQTYPPTRNAHRIILNYQMSCPL